MDEKVASIIDSEVEYARQWDNVSIDKRPLLDADKPVEHWVLHLHRYVCEAELGCAGVDKTPALIAIRKIAALCVRCIENNDVPERMGPGTSPIPY